MAESSDSNFPQLSLLVRRLSETHAAFLEEPRIRGRGNVEVAAVVSDLAISFGSGVLDPVEARGFTPQNKTARNRARLQLICCWLMFDPWFHGRTALVSSALGFLEQGLADIAELVDAERFVVDAERREELVRLVLSQLDLRPAGENQRQAADRLKALDSVEREQVLREARRREEEERMRRLKEEMKAREAREAAAKANREW